MSKILVNNKRSILRALHFARIKGLAIGATVAHLSDGTIYYLAETKGETAILKLGADKSPTGKEIIKEFPLHEIYDPNVALKLSLPSLLRRRVPR